MLALLTWRKKSYILNMCFMFYVLGFQALEPQIVHIF